MFQFDVSIYVSIITIDNTKGIILFYNYKFSSRIGCTNILERIIIGLAYWQLLLVRTIRS